MEEQLKKSLELVKETLRKAEVYYHAANIISYDQETICPPKAMEEQGEVGAFLGNEAFKLTKDEAFIEAAEALYHQKEALEPLDAEMVTHLHRDYVKTKNITPEMNYEASLIGNKAYVDSIENMPDVPQAFSNKFIPNSLYQNYFPQDPNFEFFI